MSHFRAHEFTFELPDELQDRTVNIFSASAEGPSDFSFVVVRDSIDPTVDLNDVLERYRAEMAAKLPHFRRIAERDVIIDGCEGKEADHVWKADGGVVHQRQTILSLGEDFDSMGKRRVLVCTATCQKEISPEWQKALERMFGSLKINRRAHA